MTFREFLFTIILFAASPLLCQENHNSPLIIGSYSTIPPYLMVTPTGGITGIEQEIISLLESKSGREIHLIQSQKEDLLERLGNGEIDGILTKNLQEDQAGKFLETSEIFSTPMAVFSLHENLYKLGLDQIENSRIGFPENSRTAKNYISKSNSVYTTYTDTVAGLQLLQEEKIDFLLDDLFFADYMSDRLNMDVRIKGIIDDQDSSYRILLNSQSLKNELDFAVTQIRKEEIYSLRNMWISSYPDKRIEQTIFTDSEMDWINSHPEIFYQTNTEQNPLFFREGDDFVGIIPEIMDLLSSITSIRFTALTTGNLTDLIFVEPDETEIISSRGKPGESEQEEVIYSDSFLSIPNVIITRKNSSVYINNPEYLRESTIVMIKGSGISRYMLRTYPDMDYLMVNNLKEALSLLNKIKVDYFIGNMISGSYLIRKSGFRQLSITGKVDFETNYRIAVSPEMRALIPILNKSLRLITPAELTTIMQKWTSLKPEETINFTFLIQILVVFAVIIAIILIWNRKLKLEIQERERSEEALRYSEHKSREAEEISRLARERAEKLAVMAESASKAKSQFLANMSHEIRTPLNSIIGFTELLDSTEMDSQQTQYLNSVKTSAEVLLVLINDVLDISKIEAGKMQINPSPVKIAKVFHEMEVIFQQKADEKGLNLRFLENDMNHNEYLLDSLRLEQVLINLIGNSIKFTESGFVSVSAKYNQNPGTRNYDITLTVADSGIGIKEQERDKIFNLFEQSENQDTRRFGGTGLGLGISSKLVQLMNGEIHVDSMYGKGSVFSIYLPGVPCLKDFGNFFRQPDTMLQDPSYYSEDSSASSEIIRDIPSILEWKRVRDSGDPDAIKEFCGYLMQRPEAKENRSFNSTVGKLIQASDAFDLDKILHYSRKMNSFFSEVLNE